MTREQERAKKADYFLQNREIISEFKSLRTDTSAKMNQVLEPYRRLPEWPVFYGPQDIQTVLSYLPDRERINARIVSAVTDSIEAAVESANRQIRTTKKTFGLPDAGGLLVIFNEVVEILSPNLVAYRVRKALSKKTKSGAIRFPEVTVVLILNVGHYTQLTPTLKGIPILTVPSTLPDPKNVESFVSRILPEWAKFDGQPLVNVKTEDFPKLTFERFPQSAKEKTPLRRQDLWRLEYQHTPYLRSLTKDALLRHGRKLVEDIGARLLKGAPKTPKAEMMKMMARFTHFLEEANSRAIDMREMVSKSDGLKERLDALYVKYQSQESTGEV